MKIMLICTYMNGMCWIIRIMSSTSSIVQHTTEADFVNYLPGSMGAEMRDAPMAAAYYWSGLCELSTRFHGGGDAGHAHGGSASQQRCYKWELTVLTQLL
jgi:hypothetical protein